MTVKLSTLQSADPTKTGCLTTKASWPVQRLLSLLTTRMLRPLFAVALSATLSGSVFGFQAEEFREWKSADGSITIRAKFVKFLGEKIELEKENGETITTSPESLCAEDQEFIESITQSDSGSKTELYDLPPGELSVGHMKALEKKLIQAKDVLALYEEVKEKEKFGGDSIVFVENKIKTFTPLAAVDAIDFGAKFVPRSEVPAKRAEAESLVNDWVVQHGETKTRQESKTKTELLKKATRIDPSSTQAAIIEGMYYYFYERDYKKATRSFKDSTLRGEKYLSIGNEQDFHNYVVSLNASAIMAVRNRNIDKAYEYLERCIEYKDQFPAVVSAVGENARRIHRYGIERENRYEGKRVDLGVNLPKSKEGQFKDLTFKFNTAPGGNSGWFFPQPHSDTGPRGDLGILLGKFSDGAREQNNEFEDFVCLLCGGACNVQCPNSKCTKGVIQVPVWKWVPSNDGSGGTKRVRLNLSEKCPTCKHKGFVKCWGCDGDGKQEN